MKDYSEDSKNFYYNEHNKKITKRLKDKYGMQSIDSRSEASPEIINNFLNYIEEFESKWKNADKKKIIEILGNPQFEEVEDIEPGKLISKIESVLLIYNQHNINVEATEREKVSDKDFYIFLTKTLPQHETEYIDISGMRTNYIYEEFFENED